MFILLYQWCCPNVPAKVIHKGLVFGNSSDKRLAKLTVWYRDGCVWWIRKQMKCLGGKRARGETQSEFRFMGEALLFPFLHLSFCSFLFRVWCASSLQQPSRHFGHHRAAAIKLYLVLWVRGWRNGAYTVSLQSYTVGYVTARNHVRRKICNRSAWLLAFSPACSDVSVSIMKWRQHIESQRKPE